MRPRTIRVGMVASPWGDEHERHERLPDQRGDGDWHFEAPKTEPAFLRLEDSQLPHSQCLASRPAG
jgi:hypothetical protein